MTSLKIFAGLCILFALYVFFAGVRLSIENQSGRQVHDVEIKYDRGTFLAGNIPDKKFRKMSLGKIGEGSSFYVTWRESTGLTRQAQFSIYFYGHSGYHSIRIEILPDGRAVLHEGKRRYESKSRSESRT